LTKKHLQSTTLAAMLAVLAGAATVQAQDPPALPARPTTTPVKVTVTISRYLGEKKVSSLPYVLSLNIPLGSLGQANLRMGSKVPISTTTTAPTRQGAGADESAVSYTDVGTNIDCSAESSDGRYRVRISIEESSVYDDPATKGVVRRDRPTFRSFRTMGSLMLRDGQSLQMSDTPDRTSGESVRVDVALAVVK
jgi:hypothetical protein